MRKGERTVYMLSRAPTRTNLAAENTRAREFFFYFSSLTGTHERENENKRES